ncbi:MAG: lipid-A-disaccharide synthase [Muribaculaceae bacterium]|nr:lipid-A-disaccharide synthase [Muribaculaceae bacterium]
MKYFLIAGEASGDIHASQLIRALKAHDGEARFEFLGGDLMADAAGVEPVIHYRDMAFMGFIEVLKHLKSIMGFMKTAKQRIAADRPDALILVDYPSFNLKMAKYAHKRGIPVMYFISPKVWAWKEYRVKSIKKYVDRMFSILPFETAFYAKHDYKVNYVGNPTVKEIEEQHSRFGSREEFGKKNLLDERPIVALVPGSRRKEIRDNLPSMITAASRHEGYQLVIAAAPNIDESLYREVMEPLGMQVKLVHHQSFELIHHARAALVTSGTATLETAILGTPQVACYRMNGSKWLFKFYRKLIKGKYVTLPNLIVDDAIIPELLLHMCTPDMIDAHLTPLLTESAERQAMLEGYRRMQAILTTQDCTDNTAHLIIEALTSK